MPIEHVDFIEQWYDRLVARTNEKTILPDAIAEIIGQEQHQSCLEIGLGTAPVFANKLADRFQRYTIVEKHIDAMGLPQNTTFLKTDWESCELNTQYDVILASHVMHYFRNKPDAIQKILNHLTPNGIAIIVVNGKDADYGPLKQAFSRIIQHPYSFTYDELVSILGNRPYQEHSYSSTIAFSTPEDLFETLRLSFDQYPEEYEENKTAMLTYFANALPQNIFTINQKIFVVGNG